MLAIRNSSLGSRFHLRPERQLLGVTINLPELKRQRKPKCELFTSATEERNQWFIKAETSLEAGRRGEKEANDVSLFCACSDQFIICWFGGFVLSIFCFLPQPSPPSGREGGGRKKKSAKHQAPGGSQVLHCQKKEEKKNPTLENKWERGSPEGIGSGWKTAKFGKPEDIARAGGLRSEHKDAFAAISWSWRRSGAEAAAAVEQRRDLAAPQLRREATCSPLAARLSLLSAPSLLPLPGVPSSPGFQMSHRRLTPSPCFSTPANEVWPAEAEPTSGLESLTFRLQASTCLQAGFPKKGGGGNRAKQNTNRHPPKQEVTFGRLQINRHHQKEKARGRRKQRWLGSCLQFWQL